MTPSDLDTEFCDNAFWDMGVKNQEIDVDALLAELDA